MKTLTVLTKNVVVATLIALFTVAANAAPVQQAMSKEAIADRIKPLAKVYVAGEQQADAGNAGSSGPRSGEDVYGSFCVNCHGSGVLGAPKKGSEEAWKPRLAQGIDTLLTHAWNGYNAMPPKGTCGDCSKDEIKSAIEFMTKGL
ncbi:c-type cytochrome [Idiomarina tyrosinivorans]|nr:cytochrome c5 family protein [Idiomarina tyrosinivorans]